VYEITANEKAIDSRKRLHFWEKRLVYFGLAGSDISMRIMIVRAPVAAV
jgi:hypothetical protein